MARIKAQQNVRRFSDIQDIIGAGENPNGQTSITPNGVAHPTGPGHNQQWCYGSTDGPRWSCGGPSPEGIPGVPAIDAPFNAKTRGTDYSAPQSWGKDANRTAE